MCELKHTYSLNHQPCKLYFCFFYFFFFRVAQEEEEGTKKDEKEKRRKQNQTALESFSSKGWALLGFEVFGFYHSVCHSISQKSIMVRHVVSSCREHPKLLFQLRDPRGSPYCNLLVTLWRPPAAARPCRLRCPRKPHHPSIPSLFLSHPPLISACLQWRLWGYFRCIVSGCCTHVLCER